MIKVCTEQMIRVFYFKAIDDPTEFTEYWGPFDLMHSTSCTIWFTCLHTDV